jgi:hypothetical protein
VAPARNSAPPRYPGARDEAILRLPSCRTAEP